jgi:hypothetical protein
VIYGDERAKFGTPRFRFAGKRISVTGPITYYWGKPEIVLTDPSQLTQLLCGGSADRQVATKGAALARSTSDAAIAGLTPLATISRTLAMAFGKCAVPYPAPRWRQVLVHVVHPSDDEVDATKDAHALR